MDRRWKNAHDTHQRVKIILLAAERKSNAEIAKLAPAAPRTVAKWRHRWYAAEGRLLAAEQGEGGEKDLPVVVDEVLGDARRKGTPATFTEEQLVSIVGISLENPGDSGNPCTHWTAKEVATEAIARKVVDAISERTVQRLFAEADLKPHQVKQYTGQVDWKDPAVVTAVHGVCDAYRQAPRLGENSAGVGWAGFNASSKKRKTRI